MKDALNHPWIGRNVTNDLQHTISSLDSEHMSSKYYRESSKTEEKDVLSFEEFQKRIFEKLDRTTSSGSMSDVSVESMTVSEPIMQALQEQEKDDSITGMKRQASSTINPNHVSNFNSSSSIANSSSQLSAGSTNNRALAVAIQNSGSQSSIENIDLPGARAGVWGPIKRQQSSYAENFRKATTPPKEFDIQFDFAQNESRYRTESNADNNSAASKEENNRLVKKSNHNNENNRSNITITSSREVGHFGTLEDPDLLLGLQAEISNCLKVAFDHFGNDKSVAPGIVASSVGSRELMRSTETIIKKLEQTSSSVIGILPDIQMAVEEGEFGMANAFFQTIKDWIQGLKGEAETLLEKNVRVIASVNNTMLLAREAGQEERKELSRRKLKKEREINEHELSTGGADAHTLLDAINDAIKRGEEVDLQKVTEMLQSVNAKNDANNVVETTVKENVNEDPDDLRNLAVVAVQKQRSLQDIKINQDNVEANLLDLSRALSTLQKVDKLLQQHASFWSHMEVVIQVLMQRANHVESMTHFTRNPRLRGRFFQRLTEYAETWNQVQRMCERFQARARNVTPRLFNFLTDDLENYKKPEF
uniref:Uncharacterized protein n=1 Tax=Aplanochytrium stocchinoi TaxID=215587 RepID=A0A6S8FN83_9STRA|mmetsp:Transcript_30357/g.37511  ORF Transcript_30357/g.37511 Transcript_30357/m.37511 type:complete len:592 (-) Transcript_30357:1178-2953(-)